MDNLGTTTTEETKVLNRAIYTVMMRNSIVVGLLLSIVIEQPKPADLVEALTVIRNK